MKTVTSVLAVLVATLCLMQIFAGPKQTPAPAPAPATSAQAVPSSPAPAAQKVEPPATPAMSNLTPRQLKALKLGEAFMDDIDNGKNIVVGANAMKAEAEGKEKLRVQKTNSDAWLEKRQKEKAAAEARKLAYEVGVPVRLENKKFEAVRIEIVSRKTRSFFTYELTGRGTMMGWPGFGSPPPDWPEAGALIVNLPPGEYSFVINNNARPQEFTVSEEPVAEIRGKKINAVVSF